MDLKSFNLTLEGDLLSVEEFGKSKKSLVQAVIKCMCLVLPQERGKRHFNTTFNEDIFTSISQSYV